MVGRVRLNDSPFWGSIPHYLLVTWKCHLTPVSPSDQLWNWIKPVPSSNPDAASNLNGAQRVHLGLPLPLSSRGKSSSYIHCCPLAEKANACWRTVAKQFSSETSKVKTSFFSGQHHLRWAMERKTQWPGLVQVHVNEYRCMSPFFLTEVWSAPPQTTSEPEIPQRPARNHRTRTTVQFVTNAWIMYL